MSTHALVKILNDIVEQTEKDIGDWDGKGKKPTNINSTRKMMDKNVHVFHVHKSLFNDRALGNNLKDDDKISKGAYDRLYTQYKNAAKASKIPTVTSMEKVNNLLKTSRFNTVIYSNNDLKTDFLIVAPSYNALKNTLNVIRVGFELRVRKMEATEGGSLTASGKAHFIRLASSGLDTIDTRSRKGLDIGHISAGSYATDNSPSARFASITERALSVIEKAQGSSPALIQLRRQLKEVKKAHDRVYTLKAEKSGSLEGISGNFVLTMAQSVGINRHSLGHEEKKLGKLAMDAIASRAGELKSSPSIEDMLGTIVIGALTGKNPKFNTKSSASKSVKGSSGSKTKVTPFKGTHGRGRKSPIRNVRTGQFSSALKIKNLINARLHDQIKHNMGSPKLNYRTGRFARSAQVTEISMHRSNMISIYYTYMQNPYATFEPSGAQGSSARNPVTLITKSVRELAVELMKSKLRITRRFE